MKKVLCAALCLIVCLVVLASCGSGSGIAGDYKLKSMMGMDIESLATLYGGDASEVENMMTLTLKDNGTGTLSYEGESTDLTWTQSGDTLTLTVDGEDQTATVNGSEITMSESGVEVVFVKK